MAYISSEATTTSLSSLQKYTWASPLAPEMDSEEYVFILSCLQPYADMAKLCRLVQRKHQNNVSGHSIALALSCMNQYELKRACEDWKAAIVHIDPDCTALQRTVLSDYSQHHLWASAQAVLWGTILAAVGLRQNKIIRNSHWPSSRLASSCVAIMGFLLTTSCVNKTLQFMRAIPRGYDVVKVRNDEQGTEHLFLIRRDYTLKSNPRVVPMYLLSGLGLGTMLMGARIAFKIRKH